MKTFHQASPYLGDREFHFILAGSVLFYLLLIFVFYFLPVHFNPNPLQRSLPARKITMIIPSPPESKPLPPPPVVHPSKKKLPVPIVPKKMNKPIPSQVEEAKRESPQEVEQKKEAERAVQQAQERERNQEVAKNKFASLFGNTAEEVIQNRGLNVLTTNRPSSNAVNKGVSDGISPNDLQVQMKNQDVDQMLKGFPSGKEKRTGPILGEHQTRHFESGGKTEKIASLRTPEDFETAFKAYEGRLKSYYDKAIQVEPSIKGIMRIRITLAADGQVLKCEVLSSQLKNKNFENEIAQIIHDQFKFSRIVQGEEYYDRDLNFHPEK